MQRKLKQFSSFFVCTDLSRKSKTLKRKYFSLPLTFCFLLLFQGVGYSNIQEKSFSAGSIPQNQKLTPRLRNKLSAISDIRTKLKIWVYFTDKGVMAQTSVDKRLAEVRHGLKDRCVWRRMKVRSERNMVDFLDLPLFPSYTDRVKTIINQVRIASRWLNALSAEANILQMQKLEKLEFVRKIEPVNSFRRSESFMYQVSDSAEKKQSNPNADYGSSFDQLNQINVLPLHQLGYSGKGVLVCLLDVGFRKSHEIFQHANLIYEWDFVNGDNDVQYDPFDPNDYSDSHGTGTWSILGGYKPGELIGPAYGADFILAKTETNRFEKPIEEDYWVAGIEWAESLGAEVISSSLGYTDWYSFEDMDGETAVTTLAADRAVSLGVVVVNAVGNERGEAWGHIIAPADGFDVISVGAVNISGNIASFSSLGPTYDGRIKPEVCALGVDNWRAANRDDGRDYYSQGSGTSFATPLVAGAVALLLEIHRDWTPAQVRSALINTSSQRLAPDNDYGWGIINAALAASLDVNILKLQPFRIDDDNKGESFGNGNGKAEAGETIELFATLRNDGQTAALSPSGTLTCPHPEIIISPSQVKFTSILPFTEQSSESPFVIKIPPFFLGHHVVLRFKVEGVNILTLYESIRITISR